MSGDGCSPACRVVCGDGFKVGPETCDPPGTVACNCCSVHPGSGCSSSACSNSVCNSDPACCSGSWSAHCASLAQNDPACGCCGTTCTTDCNYCGDGVTNLGEQCDDGNAAAGDGCSANCMLSCGNGLVDPGESCDPPGTIDNCCTYHAGGACSDPACQAAVCAIDPFCCGGPPFDWDYTCVNHALRSLACAAACNGCRTDCTSCGDGTVNRGEQCDPPGSFLGSDCCGTHPGPGCGDALCAAAVCAARPSCCALQWDASCGAAAAIEPRCGACAPLGQCNPICCVDSDSDGSCDISDACPMASNPFGVEALFDRTIYAIDKTRFGWTNVSSIDWLVGDLGQLASYSVIAVATPPVTKEFSSPLVPPSGHGYYYVVRPSCWLGSWSTQALKECTSPPGCLAGGRDANFPPPPVAP